MLSKTYQEFSRFSSTGERDLEILSLVEKIERYIGYDQILVKGGYEFPACRVQRWRNRVPIELDSNLFLVASEGDIFLTNRDNSINVLVATLVLTSRFRGWIYIEDEDGITALQNVRNVLADYHVSI